MSLNMQVGNMGFDSDGRIGERIYFIRAALMARVRLLGAIAGSIISVAALASSIAITALALASGQFGSRLLHNFMDDRGFQITLGTFNGTFLFCLVILRSTRSADEGGGGGVPQVSVTTALAVGRFMRVSADLFSASHGARDSGALCCRRRRARFERQEIERLYGKSTQQESRRRARPHSSEIEDAGMPDWDAGFDIEASRR